MKDKRSKPLVLRSRFIKKFWKLAVGKLHPLWLGREFSPMQKSLVWILGRMNPENLFDANTAPFADRSAMDGPRLNGWQRRRPAT